jgi:hypothetical protein
LLFFVLQAYLRGNKEAVELLAAKMRSKKIRQLVWDCSKSISHGCALSLENYVLLPLQRAPRYLALALELDLATASDDPAKLLASQAAARLQEVRPLFLVCC